MRTHLFDKVGGAIQKALGRGRKTREGQLAGKEPVFGYDQVMSVTNGVNWGVSSVLYKGGKEGSGKSLQDTTIDEQQRVIKKQQTVINEQQIAINRDSRVSWLILAVSFATGGIISWVWATLYGQMSPESQVQESVSSLAKKFSDTPTWYERIQNGEANILVIKKQASELKEGRELSKYLKEVTGQQRDIIDIQTRMIATLNEKQLLVEQERFPHNRSEKKTAKRKMESMKEQKEEISKKPAIAHNSDIYATVSEIRGEIMADFSENGTSMQIQEQMGGRVLVWVEHKGNRSLGFFADTPKFKDRLTKQGMRSWVRDSINQLAMVEQIESLALERDIGSSQESALSMEVKKMYTGSVEVMLHDAFSKKTGRFTVDTRKDKKDDITRKIDRILADFLS